MTMVDFFEASRGTWLNRRAVHHLDHQDDEAADSNLVIEPFKNDDPAVRSICEALNINMIDSTGVELDFGGKVILKKESATKIMLLLSSMYPTEIMLERVSYYEM